MIKILNSYNIKCDVENEASEIKNKLCTVCGSVIAFNTQQRYLNAWCTRCGEWMQEDPESSLFIYQCLKCGARVELEWSYNQLHKA